MPQKTKSPLSRKKAALLLAAAVVVVTALWFCADPYDHRILDHVSIAGVDVGGMTRAEAKQALAETAQAFSNQTMTVLLPEETIALSPEDTGIRLNVSAAVRAAYRYGRTGTKEARQAALTNSGTQVYHVDLLPCLDWKEEYILSMLEEYAALHNTQYSPASVQLKGALPPLSEDSWNADAPVQTLTITLGTPDDTLDVSGLYDAIAEAYSHCTFLVDWQDRAAPAVIPDLDDLYRQYYTAPVNASLDPKTFLHIPASYGYGFDLEAARERISSAKPGSTLEIPMVYLAPETLTEDLYFQDELGSYTSGHSDRPNIVRNLELVCQFLNGVVIQPGEEFSFNDTVGERTVERGFMYGESFTGTTRSRSAGGGVCQGSSVLHVCVLLADLEVLERANHGLVVGYTPLGQDAAVSWGGPDFRFRNNTNFPIKIVAEMIDKGLRIRLLGTDEKSYYIELEATQGQDDHQIYANCYKRKYDKQTGELISRELAVHSAYLRGA